jgi:hypothetical protein
VILDSEWDFIGIFATGFLCLNRLFQLENEDINHLMKLKTFDTE